MTLVPATTAARVRALMGSSDSTLDPLLDALIVATTVEIENYIDSKLSLEQRTEEYTPFTNQHTLSLRVTPVTGIVSVKEDTGWGFGSSSTIAASDYRLDRDTGSLHFQRGLIGGERSLQVTYTAGYGATTADIIADWPTIAVACELQVNNDFRRKNNTGVQRRGGPQGGAEFIGEHVFLPRVAQMLSGFRRMVLASQ